MSASLAGQTSVASRTIATLSPGDSLGRFQLVAPVAAGGMGKVWAARQRGDRGFQKIVAIKTALESFANHPDFETLFLDEARVASRIEHPNVCSVLDLGEDKGVLYLVMEWVGGGSLGQLLLALPERRLDPRIAARIFAQACAGLHAAHELADEDGNSLGVVHRDISPQNLLLTPEGHVKVADFGVVRARDQIHQTTDAGELKGKIAYMAPEQVASMRYDRRADIFALGATLYEATVGAKAYEGSGVSAMYRILKGDHSPPSRVRSDFPPELERIILRAMALEPSERYDTAEDMRMDLEAYLAASGPPCTEVHVMKVLDVALGATVRLRMSEIRAAITQLDAVSSSDVSTGGGGVKRSMPVAGGDDSVSVHITSGPISSTGSRSSRRGASPKMTWIYAGAVALAMVAGGVTALRGKKAPASDPTASTRPTVSVPPSAASAVVDVPSKDEPPIGVRLRVNAPSARISIDDGAPVPAPYEATVARDERTHTLRAFAPGYEEHQRSISFAEPLDLNIELRPKPVRAAGDRMSVVAPPRSAETSVPTSQAITTPPAVTTPPGRPRKPIEYGDPLRE